MKKFLLLALILVSQPLLLAEERAKFKIFVQPRAELSEERFTNIPQQTLNSCKDIVSRLTKRDMKKWFTVVDSVEQADLVIEVYETTSSAFSTGDVARIYSTGSMTSIYSRPTSWETKIVRADLKVRRTDYAVDITGQGFDWFWASAAGALSSNLLNWVKQNETRLLEVSQQDR